MEVSFSAVSKPILASRIFWFQHFLLGEAGNLAETMENQPNQHNSQSSDKEPQLPFYADLSDRLNFS